MVIVDNGSHDGTDKIAEELILRYPDEVLFFHLEERGRGRALRFAWQRSKADVCCYMDVDLSTDLAHLQELVGAILEEGYDVSTGSRLMTRSRTQRSFKREMISRAYNLCIKLYLGTRFSDAQCGFKAASRAFIDRVLPQIEDQGWFFDTELLALAEKQGYRIKDIPVVWSEDNDSRVKIVQTAVDDIKGLVRIKRFLRQENGQTAAKAAVAVKSSRPPADSL
ncbi:MAG: glycosyltransferase [Bryobacteraceae bacterium]